MANGYPDFFRLVARDHGVPLGGERTFTPRCGWAGKAVGEDTSIPRISVATDIDHCLLGITWGKARPEYFVYLAVQDWPAGLDWDGPRDLVPDWEVTEEVWIREPARFRLVGRIAVDTNRWMDTGKPVWRWLERLAGAPRGRPRRTRNEEQD
jgi:hypothetical protein